MNLSWDDLRLFLAAWEAGSLTAAATTLGLSQATLSRRLAGLEEAVGHRLFDRGRAGLAPTPAAEALHPHALTMAEEARRASAALQGLEAEPEGVVRLAVPPGLATDLVPPVLGRLRARYPRLRLEVLADNHLRDLDRHEADLALRGAAPTRGDLVWKRLVDIQEDVFASAAYVAALPPHATAAHLEWVQYSPELAHIPQARFVGALLDGRPPAFTSNSFLAMREAVRAGVGCMLMPEVQARVAGLVPVPVALPASTPVSVYLVTHAGLRGVPRVAAVLRFVEEALEGLVAGRWDPAAPAGS